MSSPLKFFSKIAKSVKNNSDILIKNGMIYDGSVSDPYSADIAISGDRIEYIGRETGNEAHLIIDARGLAVSPGFIDTHAHSDFTVIADPRAEGKLLQGITTEINGNCGMSAAPLLDKVLEKREPDLIELGIKERWNTFKEYFDILEEIGTALNVATLAGHGNIRGSVIGYDNRTASSDEQEAMSALLKKSLEEGAIGLSTGLIYPPGVYAETGELITLSRTLNKSEHIYTSHMRSEGDKMLEAIQEVIRIGRKADRKVHISHIKTAGEENWHKADTVLNDLYEAREIGISLTCDRYPYTASSTELDSILPMWTFEGGDRKELKRLRNENEREKIKKELHAKIRSENYWDNVLISSVSTEKNRWMEGRTITEISRKKRKSEIDILFEILIEEELRTAAIFRTMSEENLNKFISLPFCMIGSDSSARSFDGPTRQGKPHPRGFGTFARFFGLYVREKRLMTVPEAVYKATLFPAQTFSLKGRGRLKEGMYADIVLFDPEKIVDRATYDNPFQRPEGIHFVFINGTPAVWEGEITGKCTGRVLRP